jgi:hypothetical protein
MYTKRRELSRPLVIMKFCLIVGVIDWIDSFGGATAMDLRLTRVGVATGPSPGYDLAAWLLESFLQLISNGIFILTSYSLEVVDLSLSSEHIYSLDSIFFSYAT